MKRLMAVVLVVGGMEVVAGFSGQLHCQGGNWNIESLLPSPRSASGWSWEDSPMHYYRDNLFEYINGAAELYLAYGFKELVSVIYLLEKRDEESIVVDIYDMGAKLNAFGIYSVYRRPELPSLDIGSGALFSDYLLRFYKGKYYVELNASDTSRVLREAVKRLAKTIADKIPDSADPPEELNLLPEENFIAKSSKFVAQGLLGYDFLRTGLEALYQINDETVRAFIVLCSSKTEAEAAFKGYKDYLQKSGENLFPWENLGEEAFSALDPYHANVLVTKKGKFLVGVIKLKNPKDGEPLVKEILNRIK